MLPFLLFAPRPNYACNSVYKFIRISKCGVVVYSLIIPVQCTHGPRNIRNVHFRRGYVNHARKRSLCLCCGCRLSSASSRMRNDTDVRFPVCYRMFLAIYFCDRTIGFLWCFFFCLSVDECIVRMSRSFFSELYFNSRARLLTRVFC